MADYWGIKEINARMGWKHPTTPVEQMKRNGFLMFKRRRGKHPRLIWYTNDSLIGAYEIARCKADRDRVLKEEAKKDEMKTYDEKLR